MAYNAPGRHDREGLSLVEVMQMFPDDDAAEAWLASIRWPDGPRCPYCDSYNVLAGAAHKTMLYRCRAKDCRKRFSVRIGTVLQDSKLGYQAWALAICLMTTELNRSSMKLHRDLGITQKSAWHLAHRIREAWDIVTESMVGPVEVDDTYIGGKERNKHAHKKLHAGRGPVGKAAVVGARNRATGQVAAKVVPNTQAGTLQGFVEGKRVPNAPVYTDGATAYDGLAGREAVHHSVGEYVRGQVHTNGMESFWSMLKRGYHGTYRLMSVKHLQRYVNEFAGRHNVRDLDTLDQMVAIVVGLVGKRLRYADLISGTRGVAT